MIVYANGKDMIVLGRQGENLVTDVVFDVSLWHRELGGGTVELIHKRAKDRAAYPCVIDTNGCKATWHVTSSDLKYAGRGVAQLIYRVGEKVARSASYNTNVLASLNETDVAPDAWRSWVDQVLEAAEDVRSAVAHMPIIDAESKHWMLWNGTSYEDSGVLAEGKDGSDAEVTAANVKAAGAVMGVQINGTDLTPDADGNVNVPAASKSGLGLVRVASGIGVNDQGQIYIEATPTSYITGRTTNNMAISPYLLNFAVKAALSDANRISDMTAAEKKNARGVLGCDYRHIATVVLAEESKIVNVSVDDSGSGFNLQDIIIHTSTPTKTDATANNGYFRLGTAPSDNLSYFGAYNIKGDGSVNCNSFEFHTNPAPHCYFGSNVLNGTIAASNSIYINFGTKLTERFNEGIKFIQWFGNGNLPVGSTFEIWGR